MSLLTSVVVVIVSCFAVISNAAASESSEFTVVSWNVNARQADLQLTALRMARFQGVHLWGLCEVRDTHWAEMLVQAAGENEPGDFVGIVSRTEGTDGSCIIYDKTQFDLIRAFEIDWTDQLWYCARIPLRPPLVAHLRHRAQGQEFFFMVNRLYNCQIERQAAALNFWADGKTLPVVAVGTYDFQYDPDTGPLYPNGQQGLMALIAKGVFRWLPPDNPVATFNWDREVINDFFFLARTFGRLLGQSRIVVEPGDFVARETSNYRPVRAVFTVSAPDGAVSVDKNADYALTR